MFSIHCYCQWLSVCRHWLFFSWRSEWIQHTARWLQHSADARNKLWANQKFWRCGVPLYCKPLFNKVRQSSIPNSWGSLQQTTRCNTFPCGWSIQGSVQLHQHQMKLQQERRKQVTLVEYCFDRIQKTWLHIPSYQLNNPYIRTLKFGWNWNLLDLHGSALRGVASAKQTRTVFAIKLLFFEWSPPWQILIHII